MSRIALFLSLLMMSANAVAELVINPGDYNRDSYGYYYMAQPSTNPEDLPRIKILTRGSQIRVVDRRLDIVYVLDLKKQGEQPINPKFIQNQKENPRNGGIGKIIENVTFSNIRDHKYGTGENAENGILVDANIYIAIKSVFGSVKMKIVLENKVISQVTKLPTMNQNGQPGEEKDIGIILIELAQDTRLVGLQTSLGKDWDRPLGLILDTVARILMPATRIIMWQTPN